jgi:hypothetical protein
LLALAVFLLQMLTIIHQTEVPVISLTYQLLLDMVVVTADLIQIVQIQVMVEDLLAMVVVAVVMPLIKDLGIMLVPALAVMQVVIIAAETQTVNHTVLLQPLVPVQALQADIIVQLMEHLLAVVWAYTALAQMVLLVVKIMVAEAVQVVPTVLADKVPVNRQL